MTIHSSHRQHIDLILPIAPNANHRLRTAAEGKLPPALVPAEAVAWLADLRKGGQEITAIELSGPGDVMASWPATRACLELLHGKVEEATLSLTTLGLGGQDHAQDLVDLGVGQVTLLVDTVNPDTAAKLYGWLRPGKRTMPLAQAAEILIHDQAEAVKSFAQAGIKVTIRTTIQKGVNDNEIPAIARKMAAQGGVMMKIAGQGPELAKLVSQASAHLEAEIFQPQPELSPPSTPQSCQSATMPKPSKERPYLAVASGSGMEVDLHLGQAGQLLIYGPREDGLACLLETRATPAGSSLDRWQDLAEILSDCFCLLASHAGEAPRRKLADQGIKVILTDDQIEGLVDVLYGGNNKGKCKK